MYAISSPLSNTLSSFKHRYRLTRSNLVSIKGYTLIEILVVMTITGILFTVGYAQFREFSRRQLLTSAKRQVEGDIRLAQELAQGNRKPSGCGNTDPLLGYTVAFNTSNETYTISPNCTGAVPGDNRNRSMPSGTQLQTVSPASVKFKPLGQGTDLSPSGMTITITLSADTSYSTTVTVSSGGDVK